MMPLRKTTKSASLTFLWEVLNSVILAFAEEDGDVYDKQIIKKKIKNIAFRSKKYMGHQYTIDTTGVTPIAASDPDSR